LKFESNVKTTSRLAVALANDRMQRTALRTVDAERFMSKRRKR
jgi:hypothetical protein